MGEEDQLERDVTYCYYTNSQNSACWSGMLCATLVAMGSDVCGEPVGFKKVYVYNMKKKSITHRVVRVCCVCMCLSSLSTCLDLHRVVHPCVWCTDVGCCLISPPPPLTLKTFFHHQSGHSCVVGGSAEGCNKSRPDLPSSL